MFFFFAAIDISSKKITENTTDHVLANSPHKITQFGVIELNLPDDELTYCMGKTPKFKSNKHNELNICSMKNYTAQNFVEQLKRKLISKIIILILYLSLKPWFDSKVISIVNKRDACYKKFKSSGLETDKDILRATKQLLKTTIKKRIFCKIIYKKIRKTVMNLGKP